MKGERYGCGIIFIMGGQAGINWTDVIVATVALYGAGLSTYNLVVRSLENRARVRVTVSPGFLTGRLYSGKHMIMLTASNPGNRPVTLSSGGFILPNKQKLVFIRPQSNVTFPHEILPGKNCIVWQEGREIAEQLKSEGFSGRINLVGYFGDQIDRTYKSKPFKFDIDHWLKGK